MKHIQALLFSLFIICFLLYSNGNSAMITDNDKQTVVFSTPFTRIISLYPAHTQNLIDLGAKETIVATSPSDDKLKKLPKVHFRDDPERLIALRPDLVLIRPMISRSYPQLVSRLQQSNIQVISLQPTSIDELLKYWDTLGKLTGRERQAKIMIRTFSERTARLEQYKKLIPATERKRVYFSAIHKRMKTFAPGSMAMFALNLAGGINIAEDAIQVRSTNIAAYSKERILAKAGQIDIFLVQQGRMNPVTVNEIYHEPGFNTIKAIQEKQVYLIDEKLVSRPTMGLLDAAETIMNTLYPDVLPSQENQS